MDTPEDEKTKLISCLAAFRQFWSGLSQVRHFMLNIHLMTFDAFLFTFYIFFDLFLKIV